MAVRRDDLDRGPGGDHAFGARQGILGPVIVEDEDLAT
jgi:hypothetical protein